LSYVIVLRKLVDQLQFTILKANALAYWAESGEVQVLPLIALAHAHLGERGQTEAALLQAEAQLPNLDVDAQVDLAAVYCMLQRINDAVALLEAVVALKSDGSPSNDHALAMARLAWCKMQLGELEVARTLYQRSVQLMPDRLPAWIALAHLCIEARDTEAAQQALDSAIARFDVIYDDLRPLVTQQFTAQFRGIQLEIWLTSEQMVQAEQWLETRRETLEEGDWTGLILVYSTLLAGKDNHAAAEEALRGALKHYADSIALVSQLAELAQIQGRTHQAIHLLRRLIALAKKQDKSEVPYWLRLSSACLHQSELQARKAAEKATELSEAMTASEATPLPMIEALRRQSKNAMAQVESQEQHFDIAQTLFNELLTDNPYFMPALQGLGQQQMQRGNIDEAIALFERVKAIDPAKGYSSLINARQFPEDVATLEHMEKAARQASLQGQVQDGLMLQVATAWEKRKDYDKAFALAVEANESSKKTLDYDPKEHRQRAARTRHAFNQALFEHRKDCGVDSSLPVYVLGMPRSGTTLVEQILAGHSQIFGAGELGVIPTRIQGLNRWERHVGSGRSYPDCVDDLSPYVVTGIADAILKELQEYDPDASHIIDKLPHNFENVGLIKFLFPNAKIISVRRDPRDIAISNYFTNYQAKHGGMGFAYDLSWVGEQLADHNMMMHHWHSVFPGEILEINYEDVVSDTEGSARKMLDYIGVEWEAQVLSFDELDRPVKTASVWQVRQPIYKTSTAKWMRYRDHLAPLVAGTNRKIDFDPIDMVTLPEPGWLTDGVALYKDGKMDEAEYSFKKLLHHLPEHAAANAMIGLIYVQKGHLAEGIALMEKAHETCPWNANWRKDLSQAYEMAGETDKAEALKKKKTSRREPLAQADSEVDGEAPMDAEWSVDDTALVLD
jgi:tetratricopeptide (TPR) repeat protein